MKFIPGVSFPTLYISGWLCSVRLHAQVGQAHGGFFGLVQKALSRSEHHIWFQRADIKDRLAVTQRYGGQAEYYSCCSVLW